MQGAQTRAARVAGSEAGTDTRAGLLASCTLYSAEMGRSAAGSGCNPVSNGSIDDVSRFGNDRPIADIAQTKTNQVAQRPKLRRVATTAFIGSARSLGCSGRCQDADGNVVRAPTANLRVGRMLQKNIDTKGIVWFERILVLTEHRIYICKRDKTVCHTQACLHSEYDNGRNVCETCIEAALVLDYIDLWDMVECDLVADEGQRKQNQVEIAFRTKDDGRNCGRSYIFLASADEGEEWVRQVMINHDGIGMNEEETRSDDHSSILRCDMRCDARKNKLTTPEKKHIRGGSMKRCKRNLAIALSGWLVRRASFERNRSLGR